MDENNSIHLHESYENDFRVVNLGVARADPTVYKQLYSTTIVDSTQLPEFAIQSSNQHGYELASNYSQPYYMELEGDIHALALIDLDKEGLSEYKPFLENYLRTCSNEEKQKYYSLKYENSNELNDQQLEQSYLNYSNEDVSRITESFYSDLELDNINVTSEEFYEEISISKTKDSISDFNMIDESDIENDYVILNSVHEDNFSKLNENQNLSIQNVNSFETDTRLVPVKKNKSKRKALFKYNENLKKYLMFANRIQYYMLDYRKSDEFIYYEKNILKRIRNKLLRHFWNKRAKQNFSPAAAPLAIEYSSQRNSNNQSCKLNTLMRQIKKAKIRDFNDYKTHLANVFYLKKLPKTIVLNLDQNFIKALRLNEIKESKISSVNLDVARKLYSTQHVYELTQPYYMELEGNMHALALIDLNKDGLSEFKPLLENYNMKPELSSDTKKTIGDYFSNTQNNRTVKKVKLSSIETKPNRKLSQSKRHTLFNLNRRVHDYNHKVTRSIHSACDKSDQNMICETISDKLFSDQNYSCSLFNSMDFSNLISSRCRVHFIKFLKQQMVSFDVVMETPLDSFDSMLMQKNLVKEYSDFMNIYLSAAKKNLTENKIDNQIVSYSTDIQKSSQLGVKIRKPKNRNLNIFQIKYFNEYKSYLASVFYLEILPKKIFIRFPILENPLKKDQNRKSLKKIKAKTSDNEKMLELIPSTKPNKVNSSNIGSVDLGVARADPTVYKQLYSTTIVDSTQLPEFAIQSSNQHGYELASNYSQPYYMELEGDIHALALIDLDKEGLSEYKPFLENYLRTCSQQDLDTFLDYQNQY